MALQLDRAHSLGICTAFSHYCLYSSERYCQIKEHNITLTAHDLTLQHVIPLARQFILLLLYCNT